MSDVIKSSVPPALFTPPFSGLKDQLTSLAAIPDLRVEFFNYGLKQVHGAIPKADIYIDCRGLPDAARVPEFSAKNGDHVIVQRWMVGQINLASYVQVVVDALTRMDTRRRGEASPYNRPVKVACFCAFGIHRSRAMKHLLADYLAFRGINVAVLPPFQGKFPSGGNGGPAASVAVRDRHLHGWGNKPHITVVN